MDKQFIVVGLRAIHPVPGGFTDCLPGYLGEATYKHRYGFQLREPNDYYAWYTNPFSALRYKSESEALVMVGDLVEYDKSGWNKPYTILTVYL